MIYRFFDIDSLSDEMIAKYFNLLSETKRNTIAGLKSPFERSVALSAEILARQCLNELFDAPEFSFKLLLDPNGKSAVGNFDAGISLAVYSDMLGCAVSKNAVGMSMCGIEEYSFADLQTFLTDAELRDVFSFSRFSYTELLQRKNIDEQKVRLRAAAYMALKKSYYRAKGKTLNNNMLSVGFRFDNDAVCCSDLSVRVCAVGYNEKHDFVYAVTEVI